MRNWMIPVCGLVVCGLAGSVLFGCRPAAERVKEQVSEGATFLVTSPLEPSIGVVQARKTVADGEEVTVSGRIGGSEKPFVEGLAAFTIVDPQIEYCTPDEGCPTPWDYCCKTDELKSGMATVKLVDDAGKTVAKSADELIKAEELELVTVRGLARRDEAGNLTIEARSVYVEAGHGG